MTRLEFATLATLLLAPAACAPTPRSVLPLAGGHTLHLPTLVPVDKATEIQREADLTLAIHRMRYGPLAPHRIEVTMAPSLDEGTLGLYYRSKRLIKVARPRGRLFSLWHELCHAIQGNHDPGHKDPRWPFWNAERLAVLERISREGSE